MSRKSTPAETVGQTLERALDPLASAIKRAGRKRVDKAAMPVSPMATPLPASDPGRDPGDRSGRFLQA
jgi:glutamate N-acetyltransferase/amino-acid N-acetyltransferase